MRSYIADSGGTARLIKKLYMDDSGGTAHLIKKLYMADSGGTARLVYAAEITGTITAGASGHNVGYSASAWGSLSGYSGPAGISLVTLSDYDFTPIASTLVLGGFSSNPTSSYIVSVTANSNTMLASAATYSYTGGDATWSWSSVFGFVNGDSYPFVITL